MRFRLSKNLAVSLFAGLAGCAGPTVYFGASLQQLNPNALPRENLADVFPCPGEIIYLGWSCPECDSLTVTEDVNNATLGSDIGPKSIELKPEVDTTYTAVGKKGDKSTTKTVKANVLNNGDEVTMTGGRQLANTGQLFWQADLPAFAYSSKATVYQTRFAFAPAVATASDWFVIDPSNNTSVIRAVWSPVPNPPLVGAWRVTNVDLYRGSDAPSALSWIGAVKC